jgi:hypothetical protein
MKRKDIILIVVVGVVSAVFAIVISNVLFASPKQRTQKAEVVEVISPEFKAPAEDDKYINSESIDPTQIIRIGDSSNNTPFPKSGQ